MKLHVLFMIAASLVVSGCTWPSQTKDFRYSPPERSGLVGVRAYPTNKDVCQVIGENELTANYLDHTATLIGCPDHELEAIADRLAEGAVRLDQIGDWVLLSVPD